MPLQLVTGPANSGRAGLVLDAYRARLAEEPILVVPGFRDVEHSLRELARTGGVFGASVVRFARLFDEIALRCEAAEAPRASDLQRQVLVEEAVHGVELRALAASSDRPGFTRAAVDFVAELERSMVDPDAFDRSIDGIRGARRRQLGEAAAIYRAYRERLEVAGLVDGELFAWRAVEALGARPELFGSTPVFVYGFDSFTPIELAALEALANPAGVEVTVSLPYERDRAAFHATAPVFHRLAEQASEHVELPPVSDHYAPDARAALHGLERGLYESSGERLAPLGAVQLLSAGGARAEVELVAAKVLSLLRAGTPAGEVAVIFRDPERYASLVEQVFSGYGVPFSLDRFVPLGHTALGRGLLALLRCVAPEGTAEDLLAYLRSPGLLDRPRIADRLELEVRRAGARTANQAREVFERQRWPLEGLEQLRRARAGEPLLAELDRQLDSAFAHSYRRTAPRFSSFELDDPRVLTHVHAAIAELRALASTDPAPAFDAARVHDELARLRVQLGERYRPDRVQIAAPEAVRARRFQAVFVCGLQEGEFPRPQAAQPFLSDDDRRALAAGPLLPPGEAQLDRERHLFYVCCSRAERVLYLSSRFADEEGNPQVGSFLLEDVKDLFDGSLAEAAERRSLSDVAWPLAEAPTEAEWQRALALAGPRSEQQRPDGIRDPEVLERLNGDRRYSASALELFADCPVRWLVERVLRPDELEPDPEPLVRGRYAHAVLESTFARLRDETGSARVTQAILPRAEAILIEELRAKQSEHRISPRESRFRTAVRRLEFDLLRHLRREADAASDFEPTELELSFGGEGDPHGALRLEPEGVAIRGRIDRVDVRGREALVRDYKSGKKAYPVARWEQDNRLQVALYMLAVRELLELEPVGGVYVPLAGDEGPRGLLRADAYDGLGGGFKKPDVKEASEFQQQLDRARERVCEVASQMRSGEVRPCPDSCAWNGVCSYPSICRVEGGKR